MPEQISKYPDVTLTVLKSAGASCGEGLDPRILKKCPPEKFCALPGGEICVYGIDDIPKMTQVTSEELARVVCPPGGGILHGSGSLSTLDVMLLALVFAAGIVAGELLRKFRIKHASE
jgi:hypothetical protein